MDVSIIVQGSLHVNSIKFAQHYRRFGEVIFSSWVGDDVPPGNLNGVLRVESPPVTATLCNPQNAYLQAITTLAGLRAASHKYVIKLRSDERYTNLREATQLLQEDPDRIYTTPVYIRRDSLFKFHMGDHFMAGRRDLLMAAFAIVKQTCESVPSTVQFCPESLITRALLLAKGVLPDESNSKQIMQDNFGIIRLDRVGKFACKLHVIYKKHLRREFITTYDREQIDSTGPCCHESLEEL